MPGIVWVVLVQNASLAAHSEPAGGLRVVKPVSLCFHSGLARMVQWLGDFDRVRLRTPVRDAWYINVETRSTDRMCFFQQSVISLGNLLSRK
jgi:hypothetical protein